MSAPTEAPIDAPADAPRQITIEEAVAEVLAIWGSGSPEGRKMFLPAFAAHLHNQIQIMASTLAGLGAQTHALLNAIADDIPDGETPDLSGLIVPGR